MTTIGRVCFGLGVTFVMLCIASAMLSSLSWGTSAEAVAMQADVVVMKAPAVERDLHSEVGAELDEHHDGRHDADTVNDSSLRNDRQYRQFMKEMCRVNSKGGYK